MFKNKNNNLSKLLLHKKRSKFKNYQKNYKAENNLQFNSKNCLKSIQILNKKKNWKKSNLKNIKKNKMKR